MKLGHLVHKTNFVKTDVPTTVFRLVISVDDMSGLEYLKKFVAWIEKWEEMGDKIHTLLFLLNIRYI